MGRYLPWRKEYLTGITSVDYQHKKLFQMMNDLHQELSMSGFSIEKVKGYIQDLVEYTDIHFHHEEDLFKIYKYPQSTHHLEKHESFKKVTMQLSTRNLSSDVDRVEVLNILKEWWLTHIMVEDMSYVAHIRKEVEKMGLNKFD